MHWRPDRYLFGCRMLSLSVLKPRLCLSSGYFYNTDGGTSSKGCKFQKCTNAKVGDKYTYSHINSNKCPTSSCGTIPAGKYRSGAAGSGSCDLGDCTGAPTGNYYSSGSTTKTGCKFVKCTNAKVGEKYTGSHRDSNKCPVASCGTAPAGKVSLGVGEDGLQETVICCSSMDGISHLTLFACTTVLFRSCREWLVCAQRLHRCSTRRILCSALQHVRLREKEMYERQDW